MRYSQPVYSLPGSPTAVRLGVTLFLATMGIAYVFGALMATIWVGLTPSQVATAFREPGAGEVAPPGGPEERPVDLDDVLGESMQHTIDRRLLIQDTHVHVPVYALIAFALTAIALGLRWPRGWEAGVVVALFAGPLLDFGGQWLTKLVSGGFAYMTLFGGWLMAATYLLVTGTALFQMWVSSERRVDT